MNCLSLIEKFQVPIGGVRNANFRIPLSYGDRNQWSTEKTLIAQTSPGGFWMWGNSGDMMDGKMIVQISPPTNSYVAKIWMAVVALIGMV